MDTTEQLNGTYFFDGMSVDKEELLYWLLLDEFKKQFSDVIDLLAIASMLVSLPVIPVSGKLGGRCCNQRNKPAFSWASYAYPTAFNQGRRTITWAKRLRGEWAYTTSIGAYIGRWLPWVGAVLTAYDLAMITHNVIHRYQLIVGPGER